MTWSSWGSQSHNKAATQGLGLFWREVRAKGSEGNITGGPNSHKAGHGCLTKTHPRGAEVRRKFRPQWRREPQRGAVRFRCPSLAKAVMRFPATELKWWMEAEEWKCRDSESISFLFSRHLVTPASGVAPVGGSPAIGGCTSVC